MLIEGMRFRRRGNRDVLIYDHVSVSGEDGKPVARLRYDTDEYHLDILRKTSLTWDDLQQVRRAWRAVAEMTDVLDTPDGVET